VRPQKRDLLSPSLENACRTFGTKAIPFHLECIGSNIFVASIIGTKFLRGLQPREGWHHNWQQNWVEHFTATGIRIRNGEEYEFDVVVTSYDAISSLAAAIDVVGRNR
jgi:hypothetical protein